MGRDAESIPARRRARIVEHVRLQGAASIHELTSALGISASTVRRDLELLEGEGYLERTHGGAVLQPAERSTFEPPSTMAALLQSEAKRAIGAAAAARLRGRESVLFDSSSTVLAAARAVLARDLPLTAVTNDLVIAQTLAAASAIRTLVTGGTLRAHSATLLGEPGVRFLADLAVDVAFVGVHALGPEGLSDSSVEVAATKRALLGAARRVVLLADATKFRPASFCRICGLEAVHEAIVDAATAPADLAALRERGIEVTVVEVPA